MATQRILITAIGGTLAECIWNDIVRWSDARTTGTTDEWSPEQWPISVQREIDAFGERMIQSALQPPILYRSEHVDCWSMGDVFMDVLTKSDSDDCRHLCTSSGEISAKWFSSTEKSVLSSNTFPETSQLHERMNEAIGVWGEIVDRRLIVLIRSVLGGLWTDEEVTESLDRIPEWWKK